MDVTEQIITPEDFHKYFFDVRRHPPQPGQVMGRFVAMADLVDEGHLKLDILQLLVDVEGGGMSAPKLLQKLGGANEAESVRVCRQMAQDLASGMTEDEVLAKPYRYQCEFFFYCDPEHFPEGDPHWEKIKLIDAQKFVEGARNS